MISASVFMCLGLRMIATVIYVRTITTKSAYTQKKNRPIQSG